MRKDDDLAERLKQFALRVIRMFEQLPNSTTAQTIGKQVLRSGTSAAANYREARRGRSRADVRAKLGIVEQELDETQLWLELLADAGIVSQERMASLLKENDELLCIVVASMRKLRKPLQSEPEPESDS